MICQVNGIKLYYEKSGAGRPLLLLHGNGESHDIFHEAIPLLEKHFTVYALDSRGHGQSPAPAACHYADFAEDVRCFIHAQCLKQPLLYGFSDGGIIGLLLASQQPELLSRLIISGANLVPEGIRRGWLALFRIIYFFTRDPKMKMMLKEPAITAEMLHKIQIPTAVFAGKRDMIKESHTRYIAANIKGSTLTILPGENHGSYIVHNKKIGELILKAAAME